MNPKKTNKIARWMNIVAWTITGFALLGYLPTLLMRNPTISMVGGAIAVIPFASWAARPLRGLLVGAALGLICGLTLTLAIHQFTQNDARQNPADPTALLPATHPVVVYRTMHAAPVSPIFLGATVVMCSAVGGLFGYMGSRRKKHIEQQWQKD